MPYDPQRHHRRSIRLRGYDYSQPGAYFITICTQNRECLFGEVVDGEMELNDAGQMVAEQWQALPERFPHIRMDAFVVMPNHLHGIILIEPIDARADRATFGGHQEAPAQGAPSIGVVIGAFKSLTTVLYAHGVRQFGWTPFFGRLWQRNYYEHIIRDEHSLKRIRAYILSNPSLWPLDRENPQRIPGIGEGLLPW
ncbi:MAG TPA: transposase [Thermoflexus sp.]|nr:transposase [Thermoflexus sp.]